MVADTVGRGKTFTLTVFKIMRDLQATNGVLEGIDNDKLLHFLNAIGKGYRRDVTYHNDLHGADVAQMMHMFMKQGGLARMISLDFLDQISAIIAGACHDYDHDGFTNMYHVNFMTDRALRYHDKAV